MSVRCKQAGLGRSSGSRLFLAIMMAGATVCGYAGELRKVGTGNQNDGLYANLVPSDCNDNEEERIGTLLVRKTPDNNAPRRPVALMKVRGNWTGNVILERSDSRIRLFDSATGGLELAFDGQNRVAVPNSQMQEAGYTTLWIQGQEPSVNVRQTALTASLEGRTAGSDTVRATVLWVDVALPRDSGWVTEDNDRQEHYRELALPPTYELGPTLWRIEPEPSVNGHSYEVAGAVMPSDFRPGDFITAVRKTPPRFFLQRDAHFRGWQRAPGAVDHTELMDVHMDMLMDAHRVLGSDPSELDMLDLDPDPDGCIYDLDSPGIRNHIAPVGTVRRLRMDFQQWATVQLESGVIRCSDLPAKVGYFYESRVQTEDEGGQGDNWVVIGDVAGDNEFGLTDVPLEELKSSWDLQ